MHCVYTCNALINDSILSVHLPNIREWSSSVRAFLHSFVHIISSISKASFENITAVIVNDSNQMSNELRLTVINKRRKRAIHESVSTNENCTHAHTHHTTRVVRNEGKKVGIGLIWWLNVWNMRLPKMSTHYGKWNEWLAQTARKHTKSTRWNGEHLTFVKCKM